MGYSRFLIVLLFTLMLAVTFAQNTIAIDSNEELSDTQVSETLPIDGVESDPVTGIQRPKRQFLAGLALGSLIGHHRHHYHGHRPYYGHGYGYYGGGYGYPYYGGYGYYG